MSSLSHTAAAGVFAAIIPLGMWWSSRISATAGTRAALAGVLGVTAISMPLGLSAALGVFRPGLAGLVGWALVPIALAAVRPGTLRTLRGAFTPAHLALIVLVGVAAVLYRLHW